MRVLEHEILLTQVDGIECRERIDTGRDRFGKPLGAIQLRDVSAGATKHEHADFGHQAHVLGHADEFVGRNLAELRSLADAEEGVIAPLLVDTDASAIHRVPTLRGDVHDLDGLTEIAGHLFGV